MHYVSSNNNSLKILASILCLSMSMSTSWGADELFESLEKTFHNWFVSEPERDGSRRELKPLITQNSIPLQQQLQPEHSDFFETFLQFPIATTAWGVAPGGNAALSPVYIPTTIKPGSETPTVSTNSKETKQGKIYEIPIPPVLPFLNQEEREVLIEKAMGGDQGSFKELSERVYWTDFGVPPVLTLEKLKEMPDFNDFKRRALSSEGYLEWYLIGQLGGLKSVWLGKWEFESVYKLILDLAINKGVTTAQLQVGHMYCSGYGDLPQNYEKAVEFFQLAADQGYSVAINNLCHCYFTGKGVMKDLNKSAIYAQLAADKGYLYGKYNIGLDYLRGDGVNRNIGLGLKWLFDAELECSHDQIKKVLKFNPKTSILSDGWSHEAFMQEMNTTLGKLSLSNLVYSLNQPEMTQTSSTFSEIFRELQDLANHSALQVKELLPYFSFIQPGFAIDCIQLYEEYKNIALPSLDSKSFLAFTELGYDKKNLSTFISLGEQNVIVHDKFCETLRQLKENQEKVEMKKAGLIKLQNIQKNKLLEVQNEFETVQTMLTMQNGLMDIDKRRQLLTRHTNSSLEVEIQQAKLTNIQDKIRLFTEKEADIKQPLLLLYKFLHKGVGVRNEAYLTKYPWLKG